jgi:hypothetical protein
MQYRRSVQGRMLLTELETSTRTESKRMINHNTPQLSRMGLPVHCATVPGLSRLNTRAVRNHCTNLFSMAWHVLWLRIEGISSQKRNKTNEQQQTADKGWFSSLVIGRKPTTHRKKLACYEILWRASNLDKFFGITEKNGKVIWNFEFLVRLLVMFISHSSEISYEAQFTFNGRTGQM